MERDVIPSAHAEMSGVLNSATKKVFPVLSGSHYRVTPCQRQTRTRLCLEGSCHGKAEGLARLAQEVAGRKAEEVNPGNGLLVSVVASPAFREHAAADGIGSAGKFIQPQGIVGPVDAEGGIDDGHHHL